MTTASASGLLLARNHASFKRRHTTMCNRFTFTCMASVGNRFIVSPLIASTVRRNFIHNSPHLHLIPSKSLPCCNCYRRKLLAAASIRTCYMSSHSPQESTPTTSSHLESRVSEVENAYQRQRLTNDDVKNTIRPLLLECASLSSLSYRKRNTLSWSNERLDRAKLCNRLLELCVKEVESQKEFLWRWLQNFGGNSSKNDATNFAPAAYWDEVPHPTEEMFTAVFSAWKHVVESCSSFSTKSINIIDLMESSAQQSSSLLTLMEDEYAADVSFVEAYNANIDKDRYPPLFTRASSPDVRNYSEVFMIWGQCIDGSVLRGGRGTSHSIAFQKHLQLEASAMKSMTKLLEFMEADLYENYDAEELASMSLQRKQRPPPDRICYNIILAAMARQANPSLYEMRLVLQRMMERVKFELEPLYLGEDTIELEEGSEEDRIHEFALTFFPDVFSYNALIEARANRSAMFASDSNRKQQQPQQYTTPKFHAWQQGQSSEHITLRRRGFSSSEEEATLAENTLEEMSNIVTVPVTPNIWSYNAVIKAWLKTDSERGIQRAVVIFRLLALNAHNSVEHSEENNNAMRKNEDRSDDQALTLLGQISRWGTSLLGKGSANDDAENADRDNYDRATFAAKSKSDVEEADKQKCPELAHIHYEIEKLTSPSSSLASPMACETENKSKKVDFHADRTGKHTSKQNVQPTVSPISVGMSSRMALLTSAVQGSEGIDPGSSVTVPKHGEMVENRSNNSETVGPLPLGLPKIEPNVYPDLKTFTIVIDALARRGTPLSAKLAQDLLQLLEQPYFNLNPDITIYNSVLNAWAKAAKETSGLCSCLALAQKAEDLLCSLLVKDRVESGMYPQPNEYSFLMAVNAFANASSNCVSAGQLSDGNIAAEHAESLLNKLQKEALKTSKSTIACYGAVIRTWASLGNAKRAQKVLENMAEISGTLQLDLIHFNAVLDAWARYLASPAKDNDEVIPRLSSLHSMLMKMGSVGCGYNVDPDTSSFNHVIRACYAPWTSQIPPGDENTRQKALDIAYDSYSKTHRPDAHTYTHIFKAIAYLIPPTPDTNKSDNTAWEKHTLCATILQACCRDGQLTKSSVYTLRKMLTDEEFAELILSNMDHHRERGEMTKDKLLSAPEDRLYACLPAEWSQNGRRHKGLNRQRQ